MTGKMKMRMTLVMEYETFAPITFCHRESAKLDEGIFQQRPELIPIMMKDCGGIITVTQARCEEEE